MNVIGTAASQYFSRPEDERFASVEAMLASAQADKENSAERIYNIRDLRAIPTGTNISLESPKGIASFTHWSFDQFARLVSAPAWYLRTLPPENAANDINHGIKRAENLRDVNLLIRNGSTAPIIRSALTDSYGRAWDANIYRSIRETLMQSGEWTLPPTWDGKPGGVYRGDRDSFLILTEKDSSIVDPTFKGDGRMFRALLVRNSEVGASSVVLEIVLYRYVCGNHNLWGAMTDSTFRRRHFGKNVVRDTIRQINETAFRWLKGSPDVLQATINNLVREQIAVGEDAVIKELRSMGATEATAKAAYRKCESTEYASPRTFWGITQGLTRMSQDSGFQDERYELDQLAAVVMKRGLARLKDRVPA